MTHDSERRCGVCAVALEEDQRYCLSCGTRIGPRSDSLTHLLTHLQNQHTANASAPQSQPGGRVLPSARISSVLVIAFLGFGVLIGDGVNVSSGRQLAASRSALKLIVPHPATPAATSTAATEPSPPPLPSAGETPEPDETASASETDTPAPEQASASQPSSAPQTATPERSTQRSKSSATPKLSQIKHVFVLMLDDAPYATLFGPASHAPYLAHTLERRGQLLVRYYAVAHEQLANGIALLSGQGPTEATAANCPTYTEIQQGRVGANEQELGQGCVYSGSTETLMNQLQAKHLAWRVYLQGVEEGAGTPGACSHPQLGESDPTTTASTGTFATYRNPIVYFASMTGSSQCAVSDVGLDQLSGDLSSLRRTPSFSYIVPDLCEDASERPCQPGAPAGVPAAEGFLRRVVGQILASPAYKRDGLLVITADQAPASGEYGDSSSCCGQPTFPNLGQQQGGLDGSTAGGGEVGALLLSPFIRRAGTSQDPYNHFSLLRTIEDIYGLRHLGYAALTEVKSLTSTLFSGASE